MLLKDRKLKEKTCCKVHEICIALWFMGLPKGMMLSKKAAYPLTPQSDQYLTSPNSITLESMMKVIRIKEVINKFSFSVAKKMYREQYGESAY